MDRTTFAFDADGEMLDFAEAALLIQSSACVYSKKVGACMQVSETVSVFEQREGGWVCLSVLLCLSVYSKKVGGCLHECACLFTARRWVSVYMSVLACVHQDGVCACLLACVCMSSEEMIVYMYARVRLRVYSKNICVHVCMCVPATLHMYCKNACA